MRHLLKLCGVLAVLGVMTGCSTTGDYKAYLQAQAEANRQAAEGQKPLVELTAQPGQAITGLASLKVYTPTAAPVIQQSRPNEWAGVVGQGLAITGTVLGIQAAGKAAIGLADSVGKAGTAGYQFIQAPQANQTISGAGVIGAGTYSTTSSSQTLSGTGALGGNYTPTTTSTTSTVGDNSGSNSGNSGRLAGGDVIDNTATPTVVTQPAPVIVTAPDPVVVTQPAPIVVTSPAIP